jgi:hypothetical protein
MSFFSWFSRKPASFKPIASEGPSDLPGADATVPMVPGKSAKVATDATHAQSDTPTVSHKAERMERREALYAVVRDAMVRAGVLSASYKFKVLSLDQRGKQFLVMMELARDYGGEMGRLSEIEALIAQTAKARSDILVTAVYWRTSDHVAVGIPQKGIVPHGVALPTAPAAKKPVVAQPLAPVQMDPVVISAPKPAAMPQQSAATSVPPMRTPSRFDPIEPDEVAAFERALAGSVATAAVAAAAARPAIVASASVGARSVPPLTGYEDTEVPVAEGVTQDLSATQYGALS